MWTARAFAFAFAFAALPAAAQVTTCNGANTAFSLGAYPAFSAGPLDSSTVFTVNCSRTGGPGNETVTVGLGASSHSGTIATRSMLLSGGSDVLTYNIYRDAGRSLVWGNTIGSNTMSLTQHINNNATIGFSFTLFGRIDALQDVRPGNYADSLTITVTF